jgi:hypothetical protein
MLRATAVTFEQRAGCIVAYRLVVRAKAAVGSRGRGRSAVAQNGNAEFKGPGLIQRRSVQAYVLYMGSFAPSLPFRIINRSQGFHSG